MALPPNGKLIIKSDGTLVVIDTNLTDGENVIGMAILVDGYIDIAIYTKGTGTTLKGKEVFEDLVSHYINNTISFKGVRGTWGKTSDNTTSFNSELTDNQATPHQAAALTWTGKQAAKFGFSKIDIVSMEPPSGPPYTNVKVIFSN